jgi:hypothetical protein
VIRRWVNHTVWTATIHPRKQQRTEDAKGENCKKDEEKPPSVGTAWEDDSQYSKKPTLYLYYQEADEEEM